MNGLQYFKLCKLYNCTFLNSIYSALSTASAVSQELNVVASASIVEQPQQPLPKGSSSTARNNGHRVISMASVASTGSPPSSSTHSLSNNDCLDPLSSKNIYFFSSFFSFFSWGPFLYQNIPHVQIGQNMSKLVETCPNWSSVSKCV